MLKLFPISDLKVKNIQSSLEKDLEKRGRWASNIVSQPG